MPSTHPALSQDLDDAVVAARELARSDRRALSDHHLAIVLSERPDVHRILVQAGVSTEIVAAIARKLALAPTSAWLPSLSRDSTTAGYDQVMGDAIVHASATGIAELRVEHWLPMYMRRSAAASELITAGLDAFALSWCLAHGPDVTRAIAMPASELVTLRFHNDAVTSQSFVVEVLTEIVGCEPSAAEELMLKVHYDGTARVGTFRRDRAQELVAAIQERAQAQGFPLRISADTGTEDAPPSSEPTTKPQPADEALSWETAQVERPKWSSHEIWTVAVLATTLIALLASSSC